MNLPGDPLKVSHFQQDANDSVDLSDEIRLGNSPHRGRLQLFDDNFACIAYKADFLVGMGL